MQQGGSQVGQAQDGRETLWDSLRYAEGGLETSLDALSDAELEYVFERAKTLSDAEAYRKAGISRSTFYRWSEERRSTLNDLAQQLRRRVKLRVRRILEGKAEEAATALAGGLTSENEWVRLKAATEVLDRTVGKAPEELHVTGTLAAVTADDLAQRETRRKPGSGTSLVAAATWAPSTPARVRTRSRRPAGQSADPAKVDEKREWLKCGYSPLYFIHTYCQVYDAVDGDWIPFHLWPAQAHVIKLFQLNRFVVALKARQIGMTWCALAFALWLMLFHPAATVLLFSRRDDEAIDLLDFRLKGMYARLPDWMKVRAVETDSAHEWALSNGSRAMAFPTTAGDSYTATLVIGDEFDLVPDQDRLLGAVKPTIDNGGRMILLSRPDKSRPQTAFKNYYRAAKQKLNDWVSVFLPWDVHPKRNQAWYEAQKADSLTRTGSLDDLHEQYPATDTEALAARTLDKRIAPAWLEQCYVEQEPIITVGIEDGEDGPGQALPSIPGLRIYALPKPGHSYCIGVDPAEGNPTSDDSALNVICRETGEQVAELAGKFQPAVIAAHADKVGKFYNNAGLMVERNNHGHAVLLWLTDNSSLSRLPGHDGKEGWHSTTLGKTLLYDAAADAFRDGETAIHGFATFTQLASIEGSSLRAPEGEHDDKADAYALSLAGRNVDSGRPDWEAENV